MNLFKKKYEVRADTQEEQIANEGNEVENTEELLGSLLGGNRTIETKITKKEAMQIPTVQGCINFIANMVSMLPVKLYRQIGDKTEEIKDDYRLKLLNKDTGDTLTSTQFYRAMVEDYFLSRGAYAYINKTGNTIKSIHYVDADSIAIQNAIDPIFKEYDILVNGKQYMPHEFLKILRKTQNGSESKSIIEECEKELSVSYHSMIYEENLIKNGGNKRGFLKSQSKLTDIAMEILKKAFAKLYNNNGANVVVLNKGLEFQEASNTSVEMQLNENKLANAMDNCKIFGISMGIFDKEPSAEAYKQSIKNAVMPILNDFECCMNRDLLMESEKEECYFAFDVKEMTRGNIRERYEAYALALTNNFMQVDEVRNQEDLEPLGIEWITLGLDQVLYNPKTKEVYTPNTHKTAKVDALQEGEEEDEGGITS